MSLALRQAEEPHFFTAELEDMEPEAMLRTALERWGRRLALVTSFQAEGMVLLDMAWRIDPKIRVITLDTGRLPQETYDMIDRVRDRYQLDIEVYFPNPRAVEALVNNGGPNLFYQSVESRLACCHVRKVEPLNRALTNADAWVTGLRRGQNTSRANIRKVEIDHDHGSILKLSPLADWTPVDVENYTSEHRVSPPYSPQGDKVPRHPLYAKGYTSIGCAPCTRAVEAGEHERAGRWWWEDEGHKECGLHLPQMAAAASDADAAPTEKPQLKVVH